MHCWWECKLVQPLWKAVWTLLKKLKIWLSYDPVIPLLCIYPKEHMSGFSRDTCILMFIIALVIAAKIWKQSRCPTTDECIKKMWYIYTMEFSSARRNNDTWFDGKRMQSLIAWRISCKVK
jgi:hypothetical protein